jgi:hypothetical protein
VLPPNVVIIIIIIITGILSPFLRFATKLQRQYWFSVSILLTQPSALVVNCVAKSRTLRSIMTVQNIRLSLSLSLELLALVFDQSNLVNCLRCAVGCILLFIF